MVQVRAVEDGDRVWISAETERLWGAEYVISRGRKHFPASLPGFVAVEGARRVGLVTYEISGDQCEIVTLDATTKWQGVGTKLIEAVMGMAKAAGLRRVWLITTNDNLDAIRFYQRRGFTIAAVHVNALEESRRMKPSIPTVGEFGIAIRDEVEFERFV